MEFMDMVMDAIQSQLFQTVGLVVIVAGVAHLEKRCQQIEERIEALNHQPTVIPSGCKGVFWSPDEVKGFMRWK